MATGECYIYFVIQHYDKERGDSVIETDAYKAELAQYESPIQEVRDSL
jgi:hypothetical protein